MTLAASWIEENENKFYKYNDSLSRYENKVAKEKSIQCLYDNIHN